MQQFDFFSKLTTEWEKAADLEPQAKNDCRVITIRSGVVLGKSALQLTQTLYNESIQVELVV